ncbi:MAG: AEC family transporter [Oscillospiraceae bacterium]|nr:AEC family transporter [Oscillospiraceae bacterium]
MPLLSNFLIIAEQVSIVFLIVLLGFIGGKINLFGDEASDGMANIAVYFITPAVIITAFQREFEAALVHGFLITLAGNFLALILGIVLSHTLIGGTDCGRTSVLRASTVFGNLGMMSLPLQQALFGADGVFYCAAGMTVFNFAFWTYCSITMGPKGGSKTLMRRVLLNPGFLGTIVGLLMFFLSLKIPKVPSAALDYISNLNMPMCMLVIGQRLSKISLRTLFNDVKIWGTAALRLVIIPLIMAVVLWMVGVRGTVAICLIISVAAPAAASVNMLAITYRQDIDMATKTVSMHTLVSMVTMPLVISLVYGWLA